MQSNINNYNNLIITMRIIIIDKIRINKHINKVERSKILRIIIIITLIIIIINK